MTTKIPFILLAFLLFIYPCKRLSAQIPDSTWGKEFDKYPALKFKGLFQGRFISSMDNDVDVVGKHHDDRSGTQNTFAIKYMRVQMQAAISKRTEVVALVNLADFKSDPATKVLENAYLKYTFGPGLAITVGQFRPWFGIEETYPVDIIKSLDWSNQYFEFGRNGWMSFQIGASIGGALSLGSIPFKYGLSVVNGNGKNQIADNNSGKHYMGRTVFTLSRKHDVNIGLNGGLAEVPGGRAYACGLDITGKIQLTHRFSLGVQIEGKQGNNHILYASQSQPTGRFQDYLMRGVYILPHFRYDIKYGNLSALEASCRYEYLDLNYQLSSNPRQTLIPMLGLEFLRDYGARIQVGMQIDRYKNQEINSTIYNANLLIVQVQSRI